MSLISKGVRDLANLVSRHQPPLLLQARNYAARKGTREKRAKSKVKVETQKVGFIPHNQRNLEAFLASRPKRKFDDSWKAVPLDNVYPLKYYQWRVYPFLEAVQCHRETHHPEMINKPNSKLMVNIELNMEGEKKTRFVDNFSRIVAMPHPFEHDDVRNIVAFTKDKAMQERARHAGAQLAGGVELIKEVQNGSVLMPDFQFVLADPNILTELVVLRGVMKKKFPNVKLGTLDMDVESMVRRFVHGLNYRAVKDEFEKDFGIIETNIGTLDMEPEHLEANFASLIQDVHSMKPKRSGIFISRCLLWSPPTAEKLKVDHELYLNINKVDKSEEVDSPQQLEAVA